MPVHAFSDEGGRQGKTRNLRIYIGALCKLFLLSTTRSSHGASSEAFCSLTMSRRMLFVPCAAEVVIHSYRYPDSASRLKIYTTLSSQTLRKRKRVTFNKRQTKTSLTGQTSIIKDDNSMMHHPDSQSCTSERGLHTSRDKHRFLPCFLLSR